MLIFIFAVPNDNTHGSEVHESGDVLTTQSIIETLIRDGYDINDIRVVADSVTQKVSFMTKGNSNEA